MMNWKKLILKIIQIIQIEDFNLSDILIDEKSYKNIFVDSISYKTLIVAKPY